MANNEKVTKSESDDLSLREKWLAEVILLSVQLTKEANSKRGETKKLRKHLKTH